MLSLEQMIAKGKAKMARKAVTMVTNYGNAKTRAKTAYGGTPFPQSWKSEYNAGIDAPESAYHADAEKWATNFGAKARGQ